MTRHYKGLPALLVSPCELPGPHDEGIRMLPNVGYCSMHKHLYRPFAAHFERKSPKTYCSEKGKRLARRMETVLGPRGVS